ncbi:MAG: LysR family transcriptional regulator [Granulosicoccaceae bacterium]
MDVSALQAFVAVAETGSFSLAAERLFITQPATSKRIAALEAELDVALFDRLARQVHLTEAGNTLLHSARRILSDLATSREEIKSLRNKVAGKLRLGTSHHIGIHRLPPVLKAFTQQYKQVELDLKFMDSELACEEVASGALELAVVTLPTKPNARLHTQLIWPDPLAIVCSNEHMLAGKSVTTDTLAKHAAVLPAPGTITRDVLFEALSKSQVIVDIALETNYLETIKMMVSVGLGWSALPTSMVDSSIKIINVKGLAIERELGFVHLKTRTLSRAANAFLDVLPNT